MNDYNEDIQTLQNPTFQKIVGIVREYLPLEMRAKPWSFINHGVDLLQTENELNCYLSAYGSMHEAKIKTALFSIHNPQQVFSNDLAIVDWGCGQGLATVCFFDFLKQQNIPNKVQKVVLIEPSEKALERAKLHTNAFLNDESKIKIVNECLDNVEKSDINTDQPITLHFFSNILDIPQIDLKKLAQLVGENIIGEHYFFCVGPLNAGNKRIEAFYQYFDASTKLAEFENPQLINIGGWRGIKALIFKLEQGKTNLIHIEYYPAVQFHAGYQLDCVKKQIKERQKEIIAYSDFEVSAPFDIGASIYDDVNPVFAVLNNIITRGLPTKASPFIEKAFAPFGNKQGKNDLGTIIFENQNIDLNNLQLTLSPIAVARLQKTVLEALMTGKLDINQNEWNILVKENDVPCATLAFEDLRQMFDNLVTLSKNYETMRFPKVNLEIIGLQEFINSPLHLGIKSVPEATAQQKYKEYDMVIDISMLQTVDNQTLSFSEFKCKNHCYFNIRSAKTRRNNRHIYTSDTIEYKPLVTKDSQGNYKDIDETKEKLQYFIQLLFRKEDFRAGQLPILSRALQNKSVIGLLPTGGGKSLTYQLAAMLQPGVTIVIDPLRSLMKDQYDGLVNIGIDTCTFINSTLTPHEKDEREKQMESSQMQFVFLSPERLCIYKFRERLRTMRDLNVYFAYGVIDEVHCVSEWGHDFRFSYLHLGRNLYNYVCPKNKEKHLTLFGLTATASFDVLADVERELSGNGAFSLDSDTIVRYENTNRLELQYKVERVPVKYRSDQFFDQNHQLDPSLPKAVNISDKFALYESKNEFLTQYLPKIPSLVNELQTEKAVKKIKTQFNERQNNQEDNSTIDLHTQFADDFIKEQEEYQQAGIVFCPHRDNTGLSVNVNANSLRSYNREIGTFMGSSDDDDSSETDRISFENLEKFRENKLPLMVATKAFGMGIDKPNVRFTVNVNYSSSLESFVQEAGRAGRDKKIALATILLSDFHLVKINSKCPLFAFPMSIIKNKWFKEKDLKQILNHYGVSVDFQYFDYWNPEKDLVKVRCDVDNRCFAFRECEIRCDSYDNCKLKKIPDEARGFQYEQELKQILQNHNVTIPKENIEYLNADYETVMYFYNNNFKGSAIEKRTMYELLNRSNTDIFYEDNTEFKDTETVSDFLNKFLSVDVGTTVVAFVSAKTVAKYHDRKYFVEYQNKTRIVAGLQDEHGQTFEVDLNEIEILREKADIAKAIYRLCSIELISDFTEDYTKKRYRIVAIRKPDGEYYKGLEHFLQRYYSEERAAQEIQKVPEYRGENEIHKCLGYLTEFIYEKIAVKRKRAIDDMRTFCIQGIDESKDWKDTNEELKDFLYYYFNSKYAKDDYETENGEPFSLTTDTDRGKISSFDMLFKYLRVVDDDVYGSSGSPKDSVKHLQGAVRLIRRSLTDNNAALAILNAFCLSYLGTNDNETLEQELENSYKEGYRDFYSSSTDKELFYFNIGELANKFKKNHISRKITKNMQDWTTECELDIHNNWLDNFKKTYTNE